MGEETYRRIIRENISTREDMEKLRAEREFFIKHQKLFAEMRSAYAHGRITREELLNLRGQIKTGDAAGARKRLMLMNDRRYDHV